MPVLLTARLSFGLLSALGLASRFLLAGRLDRARQRLVIRHIAILPVRHGRHVLDLGFGQAGPKIVALAHLQLLERNRDIAAADPKQAATGQHDKGAILLVQNDSIDRADFLIVGPDDGTVFEFGNRHLIELAAGHRRLLVLLLRLLALLLRLLVLLLRLLALLLVLTGLFDLHLRLALLLDTNLRLALFLDLDLRFALPLDGDLRLALLLDPHLGLGCGFR